MWLSTALLVVLSFGGVILGLPTPAPAPTPTPTPATGGVTGLYGPGIAADSLNNSQVGGRYDSQVAYRFRATQSSALNSIGVYIIGNADPGYAGGNGGTLRITVRPDDGTADHAPSSSVLATRDVAHPVTGAHNVYTFPSPPTLVAGRLYHVVFTNVDPSPTVNFVSLDGLFVFDETARWQPAISNTDWANLTRHNGGAWSDSRGAGNGVITPIMQLNYANGAYAGMGYMEVWVRSARTISGSRRVREVFTVSGPDRRVSTVSVRLKRTGGSSPLAVRLERSDGSLVTQGQIPASAIALSSTSEEGGSTWATLRFASAVTLASGQGYRLVLTSPTDTTYSIFVVREGGYYRYGPATWFADGHAQTDDGSGWQAWDPGWGGPSSEGDYQFYFE